MELASLSGSAGQVWVGISDEFCRAMSMRVMPCYSYVDSKSCPAKTDQSQLMTTSDLKREKGRP